MNTENKLIAEFIGFDFNRFKNDGIVEGYDLDARLFNATFSIDELKFHSDWNWLIAVVEKIDSLEDCNYKIEISHYTHIDTLPPIIYRKGTMIENTYNACVDFIKWYNEQKKSK